MLFCLPRVLVILAGSVRTSLVIELGDTTNFETNKKIPTVQSEECVNSTSLSLCLCLHTEFSLCLCHSVYHHKWVDAQFFMADAQFFGADAQFFRVDAVFCCGTALTQKLCILLLLDYFHPRNHSFVSCLPFTEHVQTLFTLN